MERFKDRLSRKIWTSHKRNKESRVLTRMTAHQGTVSRSRKQVAGKDEGLSGRAQKQVTRQRTRTRNVEPLHKLHPPQAL